MGWGQRTKLRIVLEGEKRRRWKKEWGEAKQRYENAKGRGDAENAWQILSSVLERVARDEKEGKKKRMGRHAFMRPVWRSDDKVNADDKASVKVRRVMRVRRKLEVPRGKGKEEVNRVREEAADIRAWWPALDKAEWDCDDMVKDLGHIDEEQREKDKQMRLERWYMSMDYGENEMIKWVKKEEMGILEGLDKPIYSQEGAAVVQAQLRTLLCPEGYDETGGARRRRRDIAKRMARKVGGKRESRDIQVRGGVIKAFRA
jgi:hypothetical protein